MSKIVVPIATMARKVIPKEKGVPLVSDKQFSRRKRKINKQLKRMGYNFNVIRGVGFVVPDEEKDVFLEFNEVDGTAYLKISLIEKGSITAAPKRARSRSGSRRAKTSYTMSPQNLELDESYAGEIISILYELAQEKGYILEVVTDLGSFGWRHYSPRLLREQNVTAKEAANKIIGHYLKAQKSWPTHAAINTLGQVVIALGPAKIM